MKQVLFVCVHNAGRSQMAAAFLNLVARERGLEMRAVSAGAMPAETVNPTVVEAMKEVGIDISGEKPKLLTRDLQARADRIVTMGCGAEGLCPVTTAPTEDWGLVDPKGQPLEKVREIRDRIKEKVLALLGEES